MIIGLDVGGTHTDAVLLSKKGIKRTCKVPTEQSDLFGTVLSGLDTLLKDINPNLISRIVLSTTLTTNAIVQGTIDPVGIIVSSGPGINPEFYRTDDFYFPVSGSIDHRGRQRSPVNDKEILAVGKTLKKAGINHLGIIGKFSPRNPSIELRIKELLKSDFKKIFLGHQVSSNLNFPRRIATVHLNASVYSMNHHFFSTVKKSLEKKGLDIPIHILKADGGTMNFETSLEFPAQSVLSGPAASVMGAIAWAPEDKDVLVLDIGGTTTDIAVLVNKAPLLEPVGIKRGGYKSLIRSLQTYSLGLGGDSLVRTDNGHLKIGPDRKGPAMAFGGSYPTPTDALAFLGIMESDEKGNVEKGINAIARGLDISPAIAARSIVSQTCSTVLDQAFKIIDRINSKPVYTVHDFLEGYRIKPEKILLLGGPADYFAQEIQSLSGIETESIPCSTVANAIGAAQARTTCEVSVIADTSQGIESAPEENYSRPVTRAFTEDDIIETAYALLQKKALKSGSDPKNLEVEIIEFQKFNVIRGFSAQGKIFRTKIQVKPGLIQGYDNLCPDEPDSGDNQVKGA